MEEALPALQQFHSGLIVAGLNSGLRALRDPYWGRFPIGPATGTFRFNMDQVGLALRNMKGKCFAEKGASHVNMGTKKVDYKHRAVTVCLTTAPHSPFDENWLADMPPPHHLPRRG
eukprot:jgi/Mesvir1/6483/Mv19556-RA.1